MVGSASSLFDSLPARPPTPPREISTAIEDAISFLDDSNEVERLTIKSHAAKKSVDVVPSRSPPSSQDSSGHSNQAKKVGFSPHPVYHKISGPDHLSSPNARLAKYSPSTKRTQPLKSILKLSNAPPPTPEERDAHATYFSPGEPGSFNKMLQATIHQLSGPSRSSRLDAYLALNGALQAYDDVPDQSVMAQKMDIFMQFFSRDLAWKDTNGITDTQIVSQALKLTTCILFSPKLSAPLDDDFKTFLVDRSIAVMENLDSSKAILKQHMYVLSQQRFHSSIMTSGRVDRALNALQTIEDRCSGNSVIGTRLVIYKRFLEQAPTVMLVRIHDWLEHVFHSMLSSIKEVRVRAIETGIQAGIRLGTQPHAAKALQDMLDTEVEEGQSYHEYLSERLVQMISDKELATCVPRIWSAVILFFRSKRRPLEQWPALKKWLRTIQRCFNSNDISVRYQATLAWDKLVFAVMPDSSTNKTLRDMLSLPLSPGMNKIGADKFSQQVRQFTLESYYNVLHYGFRPGLSNEDYDNAWEAFVEPIQPGMLKLNSETPHRLVYQIIGGLIGGNSGLWNINLALEDAPLRPADLPKLDPRWVRSRLRRILNLLERTIAVGMWHRSETNKDLDAIWLSLMQSIVDAGSQEVKTTIDLKEAIAVLVSFFRRLWNGCSPPSGNADTYYWLERYGSLVDTMLSTLGSTPFTEDILATRKDDTIEVASTPSHRSSKHQSAPRSPLVILIGQFYYPPKVISYDTWYQQSALILLRRFLCSKSTPASMLDLLKRSLHVWKEPPYKDAERLVRIRIWQVVAQSATSALKLEQDLSKVSGSQTLGHTLRNGVDILTTGLVTTDAASSTVEQAKFYTALRDFAKSGAGDGGVVLAVMEPCAKSMLGFGDTVSLWTRMRFATHMLQRKPSLNTRQSLDQAQKLLWGVALASHKSSTYDPYEHVNTLIADLLIALYNNIEQPDDGDPDGLRVFFTSVLEFLEKMPTSLLPTALRTTQNGFFIWIADGARKTSENKVVNAMVSIEGIKPCKQLLKLPQVHDAWNTLLRLLRTLPMKDSNLLRAMEPLLIAGFSSPHRSLVQETIVFWNETFGLEQSLQYPDQLESVLRAWLVDADINLPTFPESNGEKVPASLPEFFDSQSQEAVQPFAPKLLSGANRNIQTKFAQPIAQSIFFTANQSPNKLHTTDSSPARRRPRSSASSTPKARLRHDDSQIQFAPIDSSPLPPVDESQVFTEHQKEVKARQEQNAQQFPDLSSSPMAHSTALPKSVSKRLNFTSEVDKDDNEGFGTPTGLPDANALVSDDMPSSPTPSSTKDASQGAIEVDDGQQDDEEERDVQDPPSSPPRLADREEQDIPNAIEKQPDDDQDDAVVDVAKEDEPDHADALQDRQDDRRKPDAEKVEEERESDQMVSATEYPSDSVLPTFQLHQEEEEVARQSTNEIVGSGNRATEDASSSSHPSQTKTRNEEAIQRTSEPGLESTGQDDASEKSIDGTTRIEDSFIEQGATIADDDSQSNVGSQQSQETGKKRKRRSSTKFTTRKRKQQNPLQRVWSSFVGGNQDDDDDMEDEIVVASSQKNSSPPPQESQQEVPPSPHAAGDPAKSVIEATAIAKEESAADNSPLKRGRGRPRKSNTGPLSEIQPEVTRPLKRKASMLSNASLSEANASTSFINVTPTPSKTRKTRDEGESDHGASSRTPEQKNKTSRSTKRQATAVVVSTPGYEASKRRQDDHGTAASAEDLNTQIDTPEKQLANEQATVASPRPILTPRSILGRLRDALADFKGMILGSQEEREFDDVLFDFRREAHEAGRRGRDQR